jgi:hypothetical protein
LTSRRSRAIRFRNPHHCKLPSRARCQLQNSRIDSDNVVRAGDLALMASPQGCGGLATAVAGKIAHRHGERLSRSQIFYSQESSQSVDLS